LALGKQKGLWLFSFLCHRQSLKFQRHTNNLIDSGFLPKKGLIFTRNPQARLPRGETKKLSMIP